MKKQYFHIFHQENEIQSKLVNAYMNRLCINENDQSEVMGINNWEKFYEYLMSNDEWLKNMHLWNYAKYDAVKTYTIDNAIKIILQAEQALQTEEAKCQMHFIFGLELDDASEDIIHFQSTGRPADLPSDYNVT